MSGYACGTSRRRALVRDAVDGDGRPVLNGIDHLEVSADRSRLFVHFLHPLPGAADGVPAAGAALAELNVVVSGGVRVVAPAVVEVTSADGLLTVTVATPGDHSPYELRLVAAPGSEEPPAGFDPQLSAVRFTFMVDCPSDFDCVVDSTCETQPLPLAPVVDYLARDAASLRRLLLDRLAVVAPQWTERNPADVGVALVEVLAAVGDQLSAAQDAVATEAYLGTARRRSSVRRHARLVDYRLDDGANARAWVCVEVDAAADGSTLEGPDPRTGRPGTRFATRTSHPAATMSAEQFDRVRSEGPAVFEALHALTVREAHNRIELYGWGDARRCLPIGAVAATLRNDDARLAQLRVGDVVVLEETVGPLTGVPGDADPTHRQAVRLTEVRFGTDPLFAADGTPGGSGARLAVAEIRWAEADALTFPLVIDRVPGPDGQLVPVSVVRGNVVLVDHGETVTDTWADRLAGNRAPWPRLDRAPLTRQARAAPALLFDPAGPAAAASVPATGLVALPALVAHRPLPHGRGTVPLVEVWTARADLVGSGPFAADVVVETEDNGRSTLRFGDGSNGARPPSGLDVTYRVGNGAAGNVGAEAIAHVVGAAHEPPIVGIVAVRNPRAAAGGRDPESTEHARLLAPQAFRRQERAVTEADYAAVAQRHPEVVRAVATRRWTGSWPTMFVTVDRVGGRPVDAAFEAELRAHLERARLMGHDLEIDGPRLVPLDVALTICVDANHIRSDVHRELLLRFGTGLLPGGQPALFHPDRWTFGQTVYLSALVAAAMAVPGVVDVDVDDTPPKPNRFRRYGRAAVGEVAAGRIELGRLEIAQLANDPNAPERGRLLFHLEGGR